MENNTQEARFDKNKIIETINRLFVAVDDRNWEQVSEIFGDTVLLDYTSMAGGSPAKLTSKQIIESWKGLLPGFDKTHHQTGNFIIDCISTTYKIFCYGTATHYLKNETNNNVWTVVGSYNFEIEMINSMLKITKMKFNLKYTDGNNDLAKIAQERLKK
jgi:hypothetical protein